MGYVPYKPKYFPPKPDKSLNSYLIVTKIGTHIGIQRLHFQSKFEQCGSHRSGNIFIQNFKSLIKVDVISIQLSANLV